MSILRVECYKLALFRTLPDVPRAEILWRLHFMLGAMSYATAGTDILHVITGYVMADTPGKDESAQSEAKRLSERLMPFFLGGLRAPLPQFGAPADPSFPSLDSPQQTNPQEAD